MNYDYYYTSRGKTCPCVIIVWFICFATEWKFFTQYFLLFLPRTRFLVLVCVKNILNYTMRKKIFPIFLPRKTKAENREKENPGFFLISNSFSFYKVHLISIENWTRKIKIFWHLNDTKKIPLRGFKYGPGKKYGVDPNRPNTRSRLKCSTRERNFPQNITLDTLLRTRTQTK